MDADEAIDFLLYAQRKEEEALLYQRWIAGPQFSMGFDEFKHRLTPVSVREDAEIEDEIRQLMARTEAINGNL